MTIVNIQLATSNDIYLVSRVLAPAFHDKVSLVVGDEEKALLIIPEIIRSIQGAVLVACVSCEDEDGDGRNGFATQSEMVGNCEQRGIGQQGVDGILVETGKPTGVNEHEARRKGEVPMGARGQEEVLMGARGQGEESMGASQEENPTGLSPGGGIGGDKVASGKMVGAIIVSKSELRIDFRMIRACFRHLGWAASIRAFRKVYSYLRSVPKKQEGEGTLEAVGVLEGYRGQGIGEMLVNRGEEYLKEQCKEFYGLGVKEDNNAVLLYQKLGFRTIKRYENRLGTWLYMRKELS